MAKRHNAYLHQSRHGTFTFRWRPPTDIACCFAQRAFEFSLGTKTRGEAWHRALPPAQRLHTLIVIMRAKPPKNQLINTGLIRRLVHADGSKTEVDYDASNAGDVAEADRIFQDVMRGGAIDAGQLATLETALVPPPATEQARQGRGGLTIGAAVLSVAFSYMVISATAWFFLQMSSEEVVEYLRRISQ